MTLTFKWSTKMAGFGGVVQKTRCLTQLLRFTGSTKTHFARSLSSSNALHDGQGFFDKLFVRAQAPQSRSLSDLEDVYELQFHLVKPEAMEEYLDDFNMFANMMRERTNAHLCGSWTCLIGDQDEAVHVWKYQGGYPTLNKATDVYRSDQDFVKYRKKRNMMLRGRRNQILLKFSFWPEMAGREPTNLYELRSYTLKPGTMIEWGNHWNNGIKYRQANNEPVCGFFTHIGDLNTVYHLWAYSDLESRKTTREEAWRRPGWDEIVSYTVPLMRHMTSRILVPTPFSPLK